MLTKDIEQIIKRASEGDPEAFEQLYVEYRKIVMAKIRRICQNTTDAEDICQEVFIKVHASIHKLRDPKAFPLWIHRITKTVIADYYRVHHEVNLEDDVLEAILNHDVLNDNEPRKEQRFHNDRQMLEFFVSCLPSATAEVIRMMYLEQKTQPEISALLNIPVNTVKSRAFYGRKELRRMILQYEKNNDIKLNFQSPAFLPLFSFPVLAYIRTWLDRYKGAVRGVAVTGIAGVVVVTGVTMIAPEFKDSQKNHLDKQVNRANPANSIDQGSSFQPTIANDISYVDSQSAYFALLEFADIDAISSKTKDECEPYIKLVEEMKLHGGRYLILLEESGWLEEFQKNI